MKAPGMAPGMAAVLIALCAIAAATVLGALHDLNGQAVVGVIAGAFGVVGGGAIAIGSSTATTNGKSIVPTEHLDTLTHAAAARRKTDTPAPGSRGDDLPERLARIERVLTAAAIAREPDQPPAAAPPSAPPLG